MPDALVTIYVDNAPYQVKPGQNLLRACLSLGFDIPYFCWHPALHSVGACRQCAVKQFKDAADRKGRIVMACMTPAAEGTRISIDDPDAKEFRAAVLELLMVNHPHDCPICDEGGECHLQDMTVMTGHVYRRYRFLKRTHRNQDLGPLVNHEMNRCIACYRCVRFYRDHAGGRDLDAFGAHHYVYFGRDRDGVLESPFSGNLVEVCPTGVFTDKTLKRHYTRKWDLQTAPSICVHCGVGCNTLPGARYGSLRCIRNRYHGEVNGYFLCDRGRYGYEFVNSNLRLREPMLRGDDGRRTPISAERAIVRAAKLVHDRARVIGIGSPRASLESNFALRALVGPERFYFGLAESDARLLAVALDLLRQSPARVPSLQDVAHSDAALVLGEDVANTAPMLEFSLRQILRQVEIRYAASMGVASWHDAAVHDMAARHATAMRETAPIFLFAPAEIPSLSDIAGRTRRVSPDDAARLGFAVAHAISPDAPDAPELSQEDRALAANVAAALLNADRPVIVSGPGCGSAAVMQAAANVARALCAKGKPAALCFAMPECNSMGLAMMGGAGGLSSALKAVQDGRADTVIILENDLHRRADAATAAGLLAARHVIVIDHISHAASSAAELALPAAAFAEAEGTLVSQEGRAQRFFKVLPPRGAARESWRWLRDIGAASGREEFVAWRNVDDLLADLAREMPWFSAVPGISPPAGFRIAGQKIPREPHRCSGRTAIHAAECVHEPPPPEDPDSPLAFSMEGHPGQPPAALITRFWAPGWNSPQAVTKFQSEAGGPLRGGDAGARLIEPAGAGVGYFGPPSCAFAAPADERLLVPLYHVFGSEELSALAGGPKELTPAPYVAVPAEDLQRLRAAEGEELEVILDGATLRLPARAAPLAAGLAGLPVGLPGMPYVALPARALVRKGQNV